MRKLWCLGAALSLAACAGTTTGSVVPAASLTPAEAKQIVLAGRAQIWKDPYSIRDARIGEPYACAGGLAHVGNMPNVCVCVEANARNAFGGYVGLKQSAVLISGRAIVDVMPPRSQDRCDSLLPFPDLNGADDKPAPSRR